MNRAQLKGRFSQLRVWTRQDQRAPHKPLLALYAIGRIFAQKPRLTRFDEIERPLTDLLREFGPSRSSYHPEYPFYRLAADGIWELTAIEGAVTRASNADPKKTELKRLGTKGGFTQEVFELLRRDPALCGELVNELLHAHFPETFHRDLLDAVGIPGGALFAPIEPPRGRSKAFREQILTAYEYCCAICGLDIRLGAGTIAIEAAHIKWHHAGGPDTESNGLALCSLHHKLFDRGVFTFGENRALLVSERAVGGTGFEHWVLRFHGREPSAPIRMEYRPKDEFVAWHRSEVFQEPPREITS